MIKVSLITPVYHPNKEKFARLEKSIDNQTNKDFEWIVIMDDSIDDYLEYDLPYINATKFTYLGANYGPGVARNVGFMLSDGDIIAYVDADDELAPWRIEHIIHIFEKYPNVQILFDSYNIVDNDGGEILYSPYELWRSIPNFELSAILEQQNLSIPLGVSHRRGVFMGGGMFQRGIVCGEDGILWRRMVEVTDPHNIMLTDSVAGKYYVNVHGQSRTQRRFDMGGFAFDAGNPQGSHGQYLDSNWFNTFNSRDLFDK